MVELQNGLQKLHDAGLAVVALSYDEPDALLEFSNRFGVGYPMLSDPESEIIRSFGILNTLIAEDDHPWFGIPFPGTYVTDAEGLITAKFFEESLILRAGVDQLLRAAAGEDIMSTATASGSAVVDSEADGPSEVTCTVELDETPAGPGVLRELVVRLNVPPGHHLYGLPVPEGLVATAVEIDPNERLLVRETLAPETTELTLAGTGEVLQVYEGDVILRVPLTHRQSEADGRVPVVGRVRWQSCDDSACGLPSSQPFDLSLTTTTMNRASFGRPDQMDSGPLLERMRERRHNG